jgi:tungstate transport system permease protein
MNLSSAISDAFSLLLLGDAALWRIILLSLKTALCALLLASPPALVLAYLIACFRFPGRRVLIWLAQAALAMPTVLIGLLLYMLLSRHGPWGSLGWLFAPQGMILGQALIALPVLLAFCISALQACDVRLLETARVLGASRWRMLCTMIFEARFGVMAALINGFGRVISEVGCAMMVGGNILDQTRTITTAIALETGKGEFARGIALGLVLLLIALLINAALLLLQGDGRQGQA